MKTLVVFLSLVLAIAFIAGPVAAASREMTGDVRAVNPDSKTFTLEQHKMLRGNKQHTFRVTDPSLLTNLRTGERVTVAYEKQGNTLIARDVHPAAAKSTAKNK